MGKNNKLIKLSQILGQVISIYGDGYSTTWITVHIFKNHYSMKLLRHSYTLPMVSFDDKKQIANSSLSCV